MMRTAQIISVFLICLSLFLAAYTYSYAEYLPNNQQNKPSTTFGDLLNQSSSSPIQPSTINHQPSTNSSRSPSIKELLAQLEASFQASQIALADFNSQSSLQSIINHQSSIINLTPSPTPYIPIPTFIAGIKEIVDNRSLKDTSDGVRMHSSEGAKESITPRMVAPILSGTPPTVEESGTTNSSQQPPSIEDLLKAAKSPISPMPIANMLNNIGNLTENPIKTTYIIALLGDSMVDTLGLDLPDLRSLLSQTYPKISFALLNYGQGSTDLQSGLYRLTNATTYLGKYYPPLLSFKPDILVVESFAYNHWSGELHDLDRQWLTIAKIIDTVRENSPETKIVLAATIAPNQDIFGDGVLNWPESLKEESSIITKAYLQNMINFAASQHFPLVDAYHPSMGPDGKGLPIYINQGDHLHPSNEGKLLFSQRIVKTIKENDLIK